MELVLDLSDCDPSTFTRESIEGFIECLCIEIEMEGEDLHFWDYEGDPEGYKAAPAHLRGTSAVRFIKTSNVTIHALDDLRAVFVNVFSCKWFDSQEAAILAARWFKGWILKAQTIRRG